MEMSLVGHIQTSINGRGRSDRIVLHAGNGESGADEVIE
jgi:hypothetical protein